MNLSVDDEVRFKLLSLLKDDPSLTQRQMKHLTGVSLGKVNFCVTALVQKGQIRVERFKNNSNKAAQLYHITPSGLGELTLLTLRFLKIKLVEYDQIRVQIENLYEQMQYMDVTLCEDSELLDRLKSIL